jgi:hypothetical protein
LHFDLWHFELLQVLQQTLQVLQQAFPQALPQALPQPRLPQQGLPQAICCWTTRGTMRQQVTWTCTGTHCMTVRMIWQGTHCDTITVQVRVCGVHTVL